jgi:hypothetical protein
MDGLPNVAYRHIETHRISGALGAEISGVDLSHDLSDDVLGELRQALHENLVIFLRGQQITPAQQLAFARRWGEIHLHPFVEGIPDYPEILEIKKAEADKRNFGGTWHTDQMFAPRPAMGTMLYALTVPDHGGDTMWTNQYLAYESLSDAMRRMIDPLKVVAMGEGTKKYGGKTRKEFYADRLTTDRLPDAAFDPAGVHLPVPLVAGRAGVLGQPLHAALRDQRLSGGVPADAPHHHSGGCAGLVAGRRALPGPARGQAPGPYSSGWPFGVVVAQRHRRPGPVRRGLR